MKGIVLKSQIPIRADRSHKSEMTSQLLFGETYLVIESYNHWLLIQNDYDNYVGWIDDTSFIEAKNVGEQITVCNKFIRVADNSGNESVLSGGSTIPVPSSSNTFFINNIEYRLYNESNLLNKTNIIDAANSFLNCPYLWGGKTFMGFDCSGFVQIVYKMNNIKLPRDASEQILHGATVNILQEARIGDLLFFGDDENINHVGILLSKDKIIHCSSAVKIENIDNTGIFNGKNYTHLLRSIKSY